MKRHLPSPRVALVYPPYGPPNLASLGLSILQAGIRQKGYECRTFYWAYRWMHQLPVPEEKQRAFYYMLTQRNMSPWNEWMFSRHTFGDRLRHKDSEVVAGLKDLDRDYGYVTAPVEPSQAILWICNNMGSLLEPILQDLAGFDVIGVGSTFFQNGAALALCKAVRDRWPDKITILGGANCDGEMGRALMDHFPFLDCVFSGEVDFEVPEFIDCLHRGGDLSHIRGLIWRDDEGAVCENESSRPVEAMDLLPVPDFEDWVAERKRFQLHDEERVCLPLESSRGCWWGAKQHCTFCGLNANGMGYRQKAHERFQDEVKSVVDKYGARYLFMADNILSSDYYRTFLDWAGEQKLDVELFYEIKANVSRQQIGKLAEAGIRMVQPGIEHFSSKILSLMRKGVKGIQNVAFLKYAAEHGVITVYSILAGFPGEDPHEYGHLASEIPKLVHLRPPSAVIDIEFHRFSPYHHRPEEFGIRLRPHQKYSFIFPLPETEIRRLAYQFVMVGRRTQDLSYLAGISRVVMEWRTEFKSDICTLTWRLEDDDIIIADRRAGFTARDYRLQGALARYFLEFETPGTPAGAMERLHANAADGALKPPGVSRRSALERKSSGHPEGASRMEPTTGAPETVFRLELDEIEADPEGALGPLMQHGLLWKEGGTYLNLPVVWTHVPTTTRWDKVQVP
jgi:ribosomal peptide maturation radical SAM protein 1